MGRTGTVMVHDADADGIGTVANGSGTTTDGKGTSADCAGITTPVLRGFAISTTAVLHYDRSY